MKHEAKITTAKIERMSAKDRKRLERARLRWASDLAKISGLVAYTTAKIVEFQSSRGVPKSEMPDKEKILAEKHEEIYRPIYRSLGIQMPGSDRTARLRKKRRANLLRRLS